MLQYGRCVSSLFTLHTTPLEYTGDPPPPVEEGKKPRNQTQPQTKQGQTTMKVFTGATRLSFLLFFASHIPITLMVDGQAVLPSMWYPQVLQDIVDGYATTFRDPLMTRPYDIWFSALVGCEVLCQLPFFVMAVYMIGGNSTPSPPTTSSLYPVWFQQSCLLYGSHVCTTMIPIFAMLGTNPDSTLLEKIVLLGFYMPYFVFPAWLVYLAVSGNTTTTTTTTMKKKEETNANNTGIHNNNYNTVKKDT